MRNKFSRQEKDKIGAEIVAFDGNKKLKIGIAGLGLIGGSIAWALKRSDMIEKVIAFERTSKNLDYAKGLGVIDESSCCEIECLKVCDVIFICQPVDVVPTTALKLSQMCNALLTDVGSAKFEIMEKVRELGVPRFIGGHPMAGSERVGFHAASTTLLDNAIYVVCADNAICQDNQDATPSESDVELFELLIKEMGAIPVHMEPALHDHVVAIISHLPHMIASTLCSFAAGESEQNKMVQVLAAGGFKDITRIASSNPGMWTEIALDSRVELVPIMRKYVSEVEKLIEKIEAKNSDEICSILEVGRDFRNDIAISGRGILQGLPEIRVDVSDKPGVIAKITTILGDNNINVQNVNIQNNRAYEGGSMRLTLQNAHDKEVAVKLLSEHGFVCFD